MVATRNYDMLNTGTVDLLVKCNRPIYSDSGRSQWFVGRWPSHLFFSH